MRRLIATIMALPNSSLAALLPVVDDVGGDEVEPVARADDRLEPRPLATWPRVASSSSALLGDLVGQLVERSRGRRRRGLTLASRDS